MILTNKPVLIAAAASLLLVQAMTSRAVTYALYTPFGTDQFGTYNNIQGNLIESQVASDNGTYNASLSDSAYYDYYPYKYDPTNPLANSAGNVFAPSFSTGGPNGYNFDPSTPAPNTPGGILEFSSDTSVQFGQLVMNGGSPGQSDTFGVTQPKPAAEFTFDIIDEVTGVGRHFVVDGVIDQENTVQNTYISHLVDSTTGLNIGGTNAQFEAQTISVYSLSGDYGTDPYDSTMLISSSSVSTTHVGGSSPINTNSQIVISNVAFDPGETLSIYVTQYSPFSPPESTITPDQRQTLSGFVIFGSADVPEPGPMTIAIAMGAFSIAGLSQRIRLNRKK